MFCKYGILLLQIRPCIHRRLFHPSRNDCFRKQNLEFVKKQLVKDYTIFIRNKTGMVVREEESDKTL